jgi:hypothetical protein
MALKHFLYGCPWCGEIPLEGTGSSARCPRCARSFQQAGADPRIRVTSPGCRPESYPAATLALRLAGLGPPEERMPRGRRSPGRTSPGGTEPLIESQAVSRVSSRETPLTTRGELLGYVERPGPPRTGTLRLHSHHLEFTARTRRSTGRELHDQEVPEPGVQRWLLRDLRALQTSSASLQLSPLSGEVIEFTFSSHSPLLWAQLLEARLRAIWLEEGRGEIVEFQPRIRTS